MTGGKLISGLDREDWLTLLLPAGLILAAVYISVRGASEFLRRNVAGLEGASQVLIILLFGATAAVCAGIMNAFAARWLSDHEWPSRWLCRLFGDHFLSADLVHVIMERFDGETLPYTAVAWARSGDDRYAGEAPGFIKPLMAAIESLVGTVPPPLPAEDWKSRMLFTEGRAYQHVASDVIRAWVLARVGGTIGREAWSHAVKFRHMSGAYDSLSTAMPIGILVTLLPPVAGLGIQALGTGPTPAIFLLITGITVAALLGVLALCTMLCHFLQVQALVNWIQWQGEVCRLFFVAYSQETTKPTSA